MKITNTIIIIFLAIIQNFIAGNSPEKTIAVLDFKAVDLQLLQAKNITERLRKQINETGAMRQMEREYIYRVLRSEGVKKINCITPQCTADLGDILDVDYLATGELIKVADSTFIIDMNMVHIPTRIVSRSKRVQVQGELADVVVDMELLAWNMMWLSPPELLLAKKRLGRHDPTVLAMVKPRTKEDALKKSLWFPGIGSIYRGNKLPGFAFIGLEITFIGLTMHNQSQITQLKKNRDKNLVKYRELTHADSIKKYFDILNGIDKKMGKANDNMFLFSLSALGTWGISIAHAYYADLKEDEYAHTRTYQFSYNPFTHRAQISWYF